MLLYFYCKCTLFYYIWKNFNFCPVGLDVQSTYTPYYIGAKKISNNANSLESAQASQVLVNSYFWNENIHQSSKLCEINIWECSKKTSIVQYTGKYSIFFIMVNVCIILKLNLRRLKQHNTLFWFHELCFKLENSKPMYINYCLHHFKLL